MKIVIISTAYPLRGGIAHYASLLYQHLSKHHEVSVITFKRQYPKLIFPGKSQNETGNHGAVIPSAQIIDTLNPLTWYKAGRLAAERRPDLVIFNYSMPFFVPTYGLVARIAKKSSAKVMIICHNVLPHERTPFDKPLISWLFRTGDCFIVQAKSEEKDLLSLVKNPKYKIVPHPVYEMFGKAIEKSEARKEIGIHANENVALFFGFVRKYKGLHILLDAAQRALEKMEFKLLVVGEFYDDEQSYRQQIEELGLKNNVIVVSNYVPNNEVAKYFSASDVVVLPYIDATQSGIVQIAYNFNKPVITTNVGGLAEVVVDGKTGMVVQPNSIDELASAIVKFFGGEFAKKFSERVAEQKKLYSWDNLVKAIEELTTEIE